VTDYYVAYWGTEGDTVRPAFELLPASAKMTKQFKEQLIPGTEGIKPTYVRWHRQQAGQARVHLVTFTDEVLKAQQVKALLQQAVKFVENKTPRRSSAGFSR
jgi:hypothetical protein